MLSEVKKEELKGIVNQSLNRAEELWGNTFDKALIFKEAELSRTNIPGHRYLDEKQYASDLFIALMLDMRDSKTHLRQAISARIAKVSQMQRVFYEVSALLPAMAKIIEDENGAVTEYLGDGLLALFQLSKIPKEQGPIIESTYFASNNCMIALNEVINPILSSRYSLPKIDIGIGIAFSDAIISHFGLKPNTQIKVIGECIYFASNLSKGRNEIIVHENLQRIWPKTEGGRLRFREKVFKDLKGFIVY